MPIDNTNSAMADTEIHYLPSRHVGDEFKLFIAHPTMPVPAGTRVPVIYALDGNACFGIVTDTARMMSLEGSVPPAFVVGIGYRTSWIMTDAFEKRSRDLTPSSLPLFDQLGSTMIPGLAGRIMQSGRAESFLRFVQEELKPFIEARYPVDPGDATITGVSLGGLWPLYTLFTAPETFQRYLACSPSIWWDNEWLIGQEARYHAAHAALTARVFVATGGEEHHEAFERQMSALPEALAPLREAMRNREGKVCMSEYLESFLPAVQSRGYEGLTLTTHRFDGETHNSVYGPAVARGLRVLFARPSDRGADEYAVAAARAE
jgi:predicted alpha/beta superfamily hydrolase